MNSLMDNESLSEYINNLKYKSVGLNSSQNRAYSCPICKDRKSILYEKNGIEYARTCECFNKDIIEARIKKSGLSEKFINNSFENYDVRDNLKLSEIKNKVYNYALFVTKDNLSEVSSLYLGGQVGAGKTHLGIACSKVLIEKGIQVIYIQYREKFTKLKYLLFSRKDDYFKEIDYFQNAEMLYIDDFFKGKVNEWDINIMYEIINYRYNNNKPFIISSEHYLNNIIKIDKGLGGRILEMCSDNYINFVGKELNYRILS